LAESFVWTFAAIHAAEAQDRHSGCLQVPCAVRGMTARSITDRFGRGPGVARETRRSAWRGSPRAGLSVADRAPGFWGQVTGSKRAACVAIGCFVDAAGSLS
jgi:hypothetical protein